MGNNFKIDTGSKIAIVGGGPAGSFFALYLFLYAREKGFIPEVTIFQESSFDEAGPGGCKGCAGILSSTLLRNLKELNLVLPGEIILSKIEHYIVHSPYGSVSISNPEKDEYIASIYRGGGPRILRGTESTSFDGWLLAQARKAGARVEYQRAARIYTGDLPGIELENGRQGYDLVVLASGVNSKHIPVAGAKYVPGKIRRMAQDEIYAGVDAVKSLIGNTAHAFLIPHSGLIFGTLVPKGPFINVSILGDGKHPVSVDSFLRNDIVKKVLPEWYERACGCRPRAVVSPAGHYYADRFVAVGDAAVSRLYKDGIGSALLSAREAARTVVFHGTSSEDFRVHYQPFCRNLNGDNRWGHLLFRCNDRAKNYPAFLWAQQRLIGNEQNSMKSSKPFTKAAWGMFTGNYQYRKIARMVLNPTSMIRLFTALFPESLKSMSYRRSSPPRRLHVGRKKVLILGSGFGGTYVLRKLVPFLNENMNVEITMISDENFFLFSPLLHEVAMGRIETRHIAYPIRRLHWRDRFNFVQAVVEKIGLDSRQVMTTSGTFDFDYLVMALGSITDTTGLGPETDNVFTLKTLYDSMQIRNHIIGNFEKAITEKDPGKQKQLLTFVVTGAGYTGVQVVTELRDFVQDLARFYKTISSESIRILLVEAEPKIIAELHTRLGAYVMKQLQRMNIEVRLKSRVTSISKDRLEINGMEQVPAGTVIWVAGVVAHPQIAGLDVEKDSIGRVMVNEYMQLPLFPAVYAVGDCAHFEDPRTGDPIPPRAHTAVRQARVVAHNILAEIQGKDKKPYRYSNITEMVSLGSSKAVFRFRGLRLYGFPARFIWLAGYAILVTGDYNRTRIIIDWLLSVIFGRDTTLLKLQK